MALKSPLTWLGEDLGLAGRIAAQLAEEIIDGRIKPGERLLETELAEALGTSRTPVREAFRLLESDAFVERLPRRGVRVTTFTAEEVADVYLCRSYFYGLASKIVARIRTDDMVERFRQLLDAMRSAIDGKEPREYLAVLIEFNDLLVEYSGSSTLADALRPLRGKSLRLRSASVHLPARADVSFQLYTRIVEAIANRDEETAERSTREAIAKSSEALLEQVFGVQAAEMPLNPMHFI